MLLACSAEPSSVVLRDGSTLEVRAVLDPPEGYKTCDFAFNPDGSQLARFTNRAGVVHLWNLRRIRAQLAVMGLDWQDSPQMPTLSLEDQRRP